MTLPGGIPEARKLGPKAHTHLLLELGEGGRRLGEGLLGPAVQGLWGDCTPVDQEAPHGFLQVIRPEVGVRLEGVLVLLGLLHGADDPAAQLLPHLCEVGHVLQVGLQGQRGAPRRALCLQSRLTLDLPSLQDSSLLGEALLTSRDEK